MPIVTVNLVMDDDICGGVLSGRYEICGLIKNADNHKIVKHVPAIVNLGREAAAKVPNAWRTNATVGGGAVIFLGACTAIGGIAIHKYKKNKEKKALQVNFDKNMQIYLDNAKAGTLTEDILLSLISSMDELANSEKDLKLTIPVSQFNELVTVIFDFTTQLAEANGINPSIIKKPETSNKKGFANLQYYLDVQQRIFKVAA